jgi:cytidylate kinase
MRMRSAVSISKRGVKSTLVNRAVKHFQVLVRERKEQQSQRATRVITISRQLGSGGRRIAEALGKRLSLPVYDKEILELLAKRSHAGYQREMFETIDETVQGEIEDMICAFLGRADQYTYFYLLPKTLLTLAQVNCIILGRGAHLLLSDSLRVRIEASFDTRVENMIRFEGLSAAEARQRLRASDRNRDRFIEKMLAVLPAHYCCNRNQLCYDLTINTDNLNVAAAADLIDRAAEKRFGN